MSLQDLENPLLITPDPIDIQVPCPKSKTEQGESHWIQPPKESMSLSYCAWSGCDILFLPSSSLLVSPAIEIHQDEGEHQYVQRHDNCKGQVVWKDAVPYQDKKGGLSNGWKTGQPERRVEEPMAWCLGGHQQQLQRRVEQGKDRHG